MKKLIIAILCLVSISCATKQRCFDRWGTTVDSTYTTWHDTSYFIIIRPDTVSGHGMIHDTVYVNNGTSGGHAWVVRDTIYLEVWNNDTIIEYRDSIKTVYVDKVVTIKEPREFSGKLWQWIILIGLLLIGVIYIMRRR